MHECIIVYRNEDGRIGAVRDGDYGIAVFVNLNEAIAYCDGNAEFRSGTDFQIVELDEL